MSEHHDHPQPVTIEIAGADFNFRPVKVDGHAATAINICEAAGERPADEFVVLRRLESLELELLNSHEPILVRTHPVERFFVIRGSVLYRFVADDLMFEWPQEIVVGRTIKRLLDKDRDDIELFVTDHEGERRVGGDDPVNLAQHGLERFHTRAAHPEIIIIVDGDPYPTHERVMTANQIIEKAAEKDPAAYYLRELTPEGPISFKDRGETPIHLHNCQKFQAVLIGPTPVSDPQQRYGVEVFMDGLRSLGFNPTQVPNNTSHVVIDYLVESGRFAGKRVKLGFIVPGDFPMNPPSGPHVSPEIHPIKADGDHPAGHVHKQHSAAFEVMGGGWQYWSRPFPDWAKSKRNVGAYMAYIGQLWDLQ